MATVPEIIETAQTESEQIGQTPKRPATDDENNILNTLEFFDRYPNSQYKTYDDAKKLLESDLNTDVLTTIIGEFETRASTDKKFKESGGRDLNLMNDSFNKVIKGVGKKDAELAKNLNFQNLKDNYSNIKEYLDEDDVYKLSGIDPSIGAPASARLSFAFSLQNEDTIKDAAHNSIVYTLPKDKQELYTGLNYKGPRIFVDNQEFDDGQKRLVYKVPKELGGDGKVRLFNEPGEWAKDIVGYTPQVVQLVADATVGYFTAAGGPNAVALGTAATNFATEYSRLLMGQLFFNQNKNMTTENMVAEAAKSAAITGAATRVLFPIANLINRSIRTAGAVTGISSGNLSKKVISDFVDAYKKGINKDETSDAFITKIKDQLTKPKDQGGAGVSEADADILIKKTFSQNLPGTRIANLETEVKTAPKGKGFPKPLGIGEKANQAAIEAEKISLDVQKKVLSDITGVDISKISTLDTASDAFKIAENIAKSNYRANLIRQEDFTKKFITQWDDISKKYVLKLNPEEKNFNVVLQKFLDPIKNNNFATSERLRGQINELTKNVKITIPKTNLNKGFVSPSKIFDESINGLNKTINQSKALNLTDKDLTDLYDSRNLLKNLKIKLKTKKDLSYLEVEDTLDTLEFLKGKYPNLDQTLTKVETSLRAARSEIINKLPPNQAKQITSSIFKFNQNKAVLREDVLGRVIANLKGVRGPIAQNKALTAPDQFPVLFGNSQEQLTALRYLKQASSGKLNQPKLNELKTLMYDRFIRDVTPIERGGRGVPLKKWMSQYKQAYSQIFDPKEMSNFNNIINARGAVEKVVNQTLSMNQAAKNIFPTLKNLDITNITPANIANALFDPKLKPSQVKGFFNRIGVNNSDTIKSYYLKTIFDQTRTSSPLLGRETLDGRKLLGLLSDVKNEQVFTNIFGKDVFKNFKTVAASLDFMQNTSRFLGKEMTQAQEDAVRRTATRVAYGPLSHENIVLSAIVKVMNSFDNKLGKELLDYDLFVEKFKKSYAAKYAPALNDEKFLKLFNTYDAGLLQRGYTSLLGGLGTAESQRYDGLEDAGLPTSPLEAVPSVLGAVPSVLGAVEKVPYVKEGFDSLNKILDMLRPEKPSKEQKQTLETLKKIRKEKEKQSAAKK